MRPTEWAGRRHPTRPPERADLAPAVLTVLLLLLPLLGHLAAEEPSPPGVLVQTRHALFRGLLMTPTSGNAEGVAAFLGIRYASAPVRRLRFMPPTAYHYAAGQEHRVQQPGPICRQRWPVDPTEGGPQPLEGAESGQLQLTKRVLARASYAHLRHQLRRLAASEQSEDCLNLNVFVPMEAINRAARRRNSSDNNNRQQSQPLPVLVIIQGDSLDLGASSLLEPQRFIQRHPSQLVVTLNYRLNILGFPPKLAAASRGNLGLMDQVAALHWIKDNIGSFGGSPTRVTLLGSKRAAIFVNLLMLSPLAKGLFQRAVVEDGSALSPLLAAPAGQWAPEQHTYQLVGSAAGAQLHLRLLARLCDCPADGGPSANQSELLRQNALTLECLKQKPVEQLMQRVPLGLIEPAANQNKVQLAARWQRPLKELELDFLPDPTQPISAEQLAKLIGHVSRLELDSAANNSLAADLFAAIHDPSTSSAQFGPTADGIVVPGDEDLASLMLRPGSNFAQRDLLVGFSRPALALAVDPAQGDQRAPAEPAHFRLGPEHPMAEQLGERLERLGANEQQALELVNGFVRAAYRFHNQEIANSIINHYLTPATRARRHATRAEPTQQTLLLAALLEAFEDALVGAPLLRTALIHASRQLDALAEAFASQQLQRYQLDQQQVVEAEQLMEPFVHFALSLLADPNWPLELLHPEQEPNGARQPKATYLYQLDSERLIAKLKSELRRLGEPPDELYQTAAGQLIRPNPKVLSQIRDALSGLLVELQSSPVLLNQLGIGCSFQPTFQQNPGQASVAESFAERLCQDTSAHLARFVATGNVNRWPQDSSHNPTSDFGLFAAQLLDYESRCLQSTDHHLVLSNLSSEHDSDCHQLLNQLTLDYLSQTEQKQTNLWPVFNLFTQQVARLPGLRGEIQAGAIEDDSGQRSGFMARAWFWSNFVPALNCGRTQPVLPVALMSMASQHRIGWTQQTTANRSAQVTLGLNLAFSCNQAGAVRTARDALDSLVLAIKQQLNQRLLQWRQLSKAKTSQPSEHSENHHSLRNASNMSSTLLHLENQQDGLSANQLQDQLAGNNKTAAGPAEGASRQRIHYAVVALILSGLSLGVALTCVILRSKLNKTVKLNGGLTEPEETAPADVIPQEAELPSQREHSPPQNQLVATVSVPNSLEGAILQQRPPNESQQIFYWDSSLAPGKGMSATPVAVYQNSLDEREPIMMPILRQESPIEQQASQQRHRRACLDGFLAAGSSSDTQNQSSSVASSQRPTTAKKRVKISDPSLQFSSLARPACRQHQQQQQQLESYCPVHQQHFYTLRGQHQHHQPTWLAQAPEPNHPRASTFGHLLSQPHQHQQLLLTEPAQIGTTSLLASGVEPTLHHQFADDATFGLATQNY